MDHNYLHSSLVRNNDVVISSTIQSVRPKRWLPSVLIALGCSSFLSYWFTTGVRPSDVFALVVASAWVIFVPGWVMSRAIWGKPRQFVTEAALASGIGIVSSTLVWLLMLAAGLQGFFLLWPLITAPLFLVAKREILDFRPFKRHMSIITAAGLALATVLIGGALSRGLFATSALPDGDIAWYQDLPWHLGLVHELGRSMPPYDPQVFGDAFWYHWFANGHIASLVQASGVDPIVVLTRLWQPLVLFTVLLLFVAASDVLTKRSWPGVVACVVGYSTAVRFTWFALPGFNSMNIGQSPSHQWALVPMLMTLIGVAELLRTHRRLAPVLIFVIGTLGLVGGKGSSLPVVICGLLVLIVLSWFMDRERFRWNWILLGIAVVGLATSTIATAAASAGGGVQLFSTLGTTQPWQILLGGRSIGFDVTPVIPGLEIKGAALLIVLILTSYAIGGGAALLGLPLLARRDLTAWFLFSVGIAAFAALQLVKVDGESQQYFMRGALPAWALLAAMGTFAAWNTAVRNVPRELAILWAIFGAALGRLITRSAALTVQGAPEANALNAAVAQPIVTYSVSFVVLLVLVTLVNRHLAWLFAACMLLGGQDFWVNIFQGTADSQRWTSITAGVVGSFAMVGIVVIGTRRDHLRHTVPVAVVVGIVLATVVTFLGNLAVTREQMGVDQNGVEVSAAEVEAALWVNDNVDEEALLATNVHCREPPDATACLTQGFWVAGISGRRVLIGGWSYTPAAHEAHGDNGLPSRQQPFNDPELYDTNQQAFTAPTPETLDTLRNSGVSVLFGDAAYTEVSPALDALATELFRNEEVVIYSIDQPN